MSSRAYWKTPISRIVSRILLILFLVALATMCLYAWHLSRQSATADFGGTVTAVELDEGQVWLTVESDAGEGTVRVCADADMKVQFDDGKISADEIRVGDRVTLNFRRALTGGETKVKSLRVYYRLNETEAE